jgi:hypothetical protein
MTAVGQTRSFGDVCSMSALLESGRQARALAMCQKCHNRAVSNNSKRCYSITSSARASSVLGTSRLSVFAVFRLVTSSYLVGACARPFELCLLLRRCVTDNQWLIGIIEHPFDNARCIRFRQTAHHLPKREPRPSPSRGGVPRTLTGGLGGNSIRQNTLGAVIVLTAHPARTWGHFCPPSLRYAPFSN